MTSYGAKVGSPIHLTRLQRAMCTLSFSFLIRDENIALYEEESGVKHYALQIVGLEFKHYAL